MRDPCDRFALRYLAAVVCGLALLLFHGAADSGLPAPRVCQPLGTEQAGLLAGPGRLGDDQPPGRGACLRDLPAAVLAPLTAAAAELGTAGRRRTRHDGAGCMGLGCIHGLLSAEPGEKHPVLWTALALALAGLYVCEASRRRPGGRFPPG